MKKIKLSSWGNNINEDVMYSSELKKGTINIGNKNSYGDAFFPKNSIVFKNPEFTDKLNSYSSSTTLKDLLRIKGIGLYGIPGRSNVTLGGAIASDTHGKDNVWGGSFAQNINEIHLQLANQEIITVSRSKDFEIFESTIGGYGLSGSILGCSFEKDLPVFSSFYNKSIQTGHGLDSLLSSIEFENEKFIVCWLDLLGKKNNWVIENFKKNTDHKKIVVESIHKDIKMSAPFIGSNIFKSMSFVNYLFYLKSNISKERIVNLEKVLYPLNFLTDTRNVSSERKIIQVQFSIPDSEMSHLEDLINLIIHNQKPLLCSIKKLDNSSNYNNLSFHQNGWTVAVDFSYKYFNNSSIRHFYKKLIKHKGKVYLAKDSTLNSFEFKEMYPEYSQWMKIIKKIDPNNIYQSKLSNRLEIKKW